MKKIVVDESKCIGCGACVGNDPEHFEFNDNGKSCVISNDNLDSEALHMAIDCCPTEAITIDNCEDECDCEECECNSCHHEEE